MKLLLILTALIILLLLPLIEPREKVERTRAWRNHECIDLSVEVKKPKFPKGQEKDNL